MNTGKPSVTIEFFGIPRQRSGKSQLTVKAATVAELLASIIEQCPELDGLINSHGQLAKQYLLSLNGERFIGDLQQSLQSGEHLLLLSADAGG